MSSYTKEEIEEKIKKYEDIINGLETLALKLTGPQHMVSDYTVDSVSAKYINISDVAYSLKKFYNIRQALKLSLNAIS